MLAFGTNTSLEHVGAWGPVTATIDWCEANYQFSYYVAELANTVSNLVTVALGLYGVINAYQQSLPARHAFGYAGLVLVGLGSAAFHGTLHFHAQLADELPMIYVAAYCVSLVLGARPDTSPRTKRLLLVGEIVFDVLFTWFYVLSRNPVYHQITFGLLVVTTSVRGSLLLRGATVGGRPIPDDVRASIRHLFVGGSAFALLGFAIWAVDNVFCTAVSGWRGVVGWPLAFLLEGHAWWHVLTALGAYLGLLGVTYLTLCAEDDHRAYALEFAHQLPRIVRTPGPAKF